MTLFILEERGRVLTDKSLKAVVKEFLQREGLKAVTTVCGEAAERDLKMPQWPEDFQWKLVYIGNGNPYLLGAEQEDKVRARVLNDSRCCREILRDILTEDGIM